MSLGLIEHAINDNNIISERKTNISNFNEFICPLKFSLLVINQQQKNIDQLSEFVEFDFNHIIDYDFIEKHVLTVDS